MKQLILFFTSLVFCFAAEANPGPTPATASAASATSAKALANSGAIRFQFKKAVCNPDHQDSVLIIFDRFDHTGAGVVYAKYAADSENGITLPQVPAGKYYVTVQCIGLHRDRMEKVITIKSKKSEKVNLAVDDNEMFSKDKVVIPAFRPDFSDLAVLKTK